jgi:hypothetical protein
MKYLWTEVRAAVRISARAPARVHLTRTAVRMDDVLEHLEVCKDACVEFVEGVQCLPSGASSVDILRRRNSVGKRTVHLRMGQDPLAQTTPWTTRGTIAADRSMQRCFKLGTKSTR